ncbi:hypothetical protein ACLOJK_034795, partial [Asimina triloba]
MAHMGNEQQGFTQVESHSNPQQGRNPACNPARLHHSSTADMKQKIQTRQQVTRLHGRQHGYAV